MEPKTSNQSKESPRYRIVVQGELDDSWSEWMGDVSLDRFDRVQSTWFRQ
jgi:hypothetical protein